MTTTIHSTYTMHETLLGRGFYSRIHLATHRGTQEKVAVKVIEKRKLVTSEERAIPGRESGSLRKLQHCGNVIRLHGEMEDEHHHFLILELADRSLRDEMDKRPLGFESEECRRIAREIIEAVCNVHAADALHLDLHPGNILLDAHGKVKLADFGSSMDLALLDSPPPSPMHHQNLMGGGEPRGTLPYAAPELVRGKLHAAADSWSIGAILYEMMTGCPPVMADDNRDVALYPDSLWATKSVLAKDLTRTLLHHDPGKRATVMAALGHSWFARGPE